MTLPNDSRCRIDPFCCTTCPFGDEDWQAVCERDPLLRRIVEAMTELRITGRTPAVLVYNAVLALDVQERLFGLEVLRGAEVIENGFYITTRNEP